MNTKRQLTIHNSQFTIKILLIIILVLAAVLRLYKLGEYPIHLTNDEAAIGYNAYSILETGRDEHGALLPVIFKSFGDWKPGLYIYLTVPSVAIFGLNEFSIRLPSAILGIIAVFLVFRVSEKLFKNSNIALASALSLAVLPWHIHFSRGAWEANLALTLQIAGIYYFLKSIEKNRNIIISALMFALSLWSYQSAKLASLIILVGLGIFYRKELFKINKKSLIVSFVMGVLLSLPIIISLFSGKAGRLEVMSVFSYTRPLDYINETVFDQEDISDKSPLYLLFHSEQLNLFRGILGRYLNYLSAKFLVFEGDWSNPRHTSEDSGYLLQVSITTFLAGLYVLIKRRYSKEIGFVLFLLFTSQIPAALTRDSAHGVRSLGMIIPITIILGLGIYYLLNFSKRYKYIIITLLTVGYIYSLSLYLDAYFYQDKYFGAKDNFYGYKQAVYKINEIGDKYNKIIFSQSFDQPYIFFLFYNKVEPSLHQKNASYSEGISGDVGFVTKLGNIEFKPVDWYKDRGENDTLIVGYESDFSASDLVSPEFEVSYIRYPNGKPALVFVTRNES